MKYNTFRIKKYTPCTSGLSLYTAVQAAGHYTLYKQQVTIKEYKEILNSYPYPTNGCKCKVCRYIRIFGKEREHTIKMGEAKKMLGIK